MVPRRSTPGAMARHLVALATLTLAACSEAPTSPPAGDLAPAFDHTAGHQVFTSGAHVDTWNAIVPVQDPNWTTTVCVSTPAVGPSAGWTNPHKAFVANGAAFRSWTSHIFTADWINAWPGYEWYGLTAAYGGPPGSLQQSWTRYSTPVSGNGEFVLYLAADNCSWIYLTDADGSNPQPVGVQLGAPWVVPITYPVTLNGNHRLEFIVFDGGGQSGGMFRLETNTGQATFTDTDGDGLADVSEINVHGTSPTNPDTDGDGTNDGDEIANGTNPLVAEVVDADGDGINDDVDNCPAVANGSQADLDGDNVGDACDPDIDGDGAPNGTDAFPTDPSETTDSDGDGVGNNADAFDNDPTETVDSDGDGTGDNADAYDNSTVGGPIVIAGCNTGATNKHLGNGTWMSDLLAAAKASAGNHGAYVSAVAALADGWKKAGLISGREQGAIVSCAARSK